MLTTIWPSYSQEIHSGKKTIKIDNTPNIVIETVTLKDENNNKMVESGEKCYLEVNIKNTGKGVAKTVNIDVGLESLAIKGFAYQSTIKAGNLLQNKPYVFKIELYPRISLLSGLVKLKIEALEANGYKKKKKSVTLNLKSIPRRLAIGWINPVAEITTVYESEFSIKNCIVSNTPNNQIVVFLNGEMYSDSRGLKLLKSEECDYELETNLKLRNGVNRVYVELTSNSEKVISESKTINFNETVLENRLALVIGNSNYAVAPLRNAANDGKAMAKALRELNFDVIEVIDGDKKTMKDAVRKFSDKLTEDKGVGLFYYAGHGVQVKGDNYLIPINHQIQTEMDVADEALGLNTVLDYMHVCGTRMNIIILDACRDNPYARSMRSASRGLAQVYSEGSGSLIAYATSPGSVAADGEGENGLYTQELLKAMKTPGLEINTIFRKVLSNVKKLSSGQQIPWTNASIEGEFYFKK